MPAEDLIQTIMRDHVTVVERVREECAPAIMAAGEVILKALDEGATIFTCGNGGSAADAQHFAAELTGLFDRRGRRALPGIALTVDTSAITSIGNDFGYSQIFSRQLEGLARPGDVLVGLTTSGRSANVLEAMDTAHKIGLQCLGLCGQDPSAMAAYGGPIVAIPSSNTARIQEMHITVIHTWCAMIDEKYKG